MKKSFRFFLHSFYCCADVQERIIKRQRSKICVSAVRRLFCRNNGKARRLYVSGLLTFSSESGLTLSYSEPSDIAGITVSLKDDTATVTCPEMEPVIVSLPDSSALCFTEKVFDALKNGECDGYAFGGRIINEGTFGGTDFRVTRDKATHNIMSVESSAYGIYIEFKYTA